MKREFLCYHGGWFAEPAWLQRLLGWEETPWLTNAGQEHVVENSIVLCSDLGCLKPALLQRLGSTAGVVLFHVSDEWYRSPLEVYRHFSHVIRNYHHSALNHDGITQIPLGPCRESRSAGGLPAASERKHVWSFAGQVTSTRGAMLDCLRCVQPHCLRLTAGVRAAGPMLESDAYRALLHESVFVPCPMGNVNLESFRLYEALDAGAIPIVEQRPWLDYYTRLLGPHPLPSVNTWRQAAGVMRSLMSDKDALDRRQEEIQTWWSQVQYQISRRVTDVMCKTYGDASTPLASARLPGKMRGRWEMLKHHNGAALQARLQIITQRLLRR
ncbi:MAG TPA: hypothetical protein DIT64_18025 [Verrucomicrobiales bacterium]|nr:hypothetical protein [Verrucomicrobiales bacterium]